MTLYLSRASLRRDLQVATIAPLLLPADVNHRALAAHRLVWSLMPSDGGAKRDFLWRGQGDGRFMLLSARTPENAALFEIETRTFEPALSIGDRLTFALRANPTVNSRLTGQTTRRIDVVLSALQSLSSERDPDGLTERVRARSRTIHAAGMAWLVAMGQRHGFELDLDLLAIDGYGRLRIPRASRDGGFHLSMLDYTGALKVLDPPVFLAALARGFGRGGAFGCGLMLIRRAPHP